MTIEANRPLDSDVIAVWQAKDPIEQQILAAGNLSEAQVEAIRSFQRRKGLTFGERRSHWVSCGETASLDTSNNKCYRSGCLGLIV